MTSTQHRCVFVGNIPYDATEDQLIRICEEVGPVVSFRLVVDRDTGKPKGYGFCEFRDEETALSARRNLQGYEINGRQLRVDFAENEKGSVDRNREQGRGGPGLAQNIDVHKQTGGPRSVRDPSFDQPIGHAVAASAAAVMAGILGAPQVSTTLSQANMSINGQQSKGGVSGIAVGTDALTNHLAGMSRHRLFEILSQMKDLIQRNQRQARQILMANPQLTKALFQAQIMLGLLPQRMPLQNVAGQPQQQQLLQQPQVQQLHMQVSQAPAIQNLSQLAAVQQTPSQQGQLHMPTGQSQSQLQAAQQSQAMSVPLQSHQPAQNLEFQHSMQALQQSNPRTAKVLPFSQPAQLTGNNLGLRPQNPTVQHAQPQSSLNLPPLPQKPRPLVAPSQLQPQITQGGSLQPLSGSQSQNSQPPFQQSSGMSQTSASLLYQQIQPSHPNRPALQQGFQGGSSQVGRGPNMEAPSGSGPFTIWNEPLASSVSMVEASQTGVSMGQAAHIGPGQPLGATGLPLIAAPPSNNGSIPVQQGPIQSNAEHEGLVYSQGFSQPQAQSQSQQQTQQQPQMQVPIELEHQKALLQQVMNLTPEQISSLGPEQRQQVLQLQQAFRSQTT